ncbi:MAG TPA: hypothetical protein VFY93_10430 [Planctomycetota bacterium]|nr:hypothetical protein [Planctomycetota bacterium]
MKAPFRCVHEHCEKFGRVVNIEVGIGEGGMYDGRYEVFGDDACGSCHKKLEPVHSAREFAAMQRSR